MSYDPRSRELAEYFLADVKAILTKAEHEQYVRDLSQTIQDAIEGWFDDFRLMGVEAES